MDKRFSRSCNFSMKEECLLISLVKRHRQEIECKKSDTNSNKIKKQAWDKIDREFNTISGETYRTSQTLRNKYENLKKRTKKKVADMKINIYGTGGGPPEEIKFSGVEKEIEEMMGSQFAGLPSEFDSDSVLEPIGSEDRALLKSEAIEDHIAASNNSIAEELIIENVLVTAVPMIPNKVVPMDSAGEDITINELSSDELNWSKYTPDMLRTPKPTALKAILPPKENQETSDSCRRRQKQCGLTTKLQKWASEKAEFASMQKNCLLEEHRLKLSHLQEQHTLQQELQKQEFQFRQKLMLEEHNKKMELLQLEKEKLQKL